MKTIINQINAKQERVIKKVKTLNSLNNFCEFIASDFENCPMNERNSRLGYADWDL